MPRAPEKKRSYTAPALSKGLDILELMTSEPEPLSLGQIADKLGRTKGEIFRMLAVLDERGYISQDRETDTFSITLKMFALTQRLPRIHRLSGAAAGAMSALSRTIGQSCHLVIHYEGKGVVVAQHDSPSDRGLSVRLGAEVPLPNSCSGHILMAFSAEQERQQMLKAARPKDRVSKSELDKIVERVLSQGFELMDSQQIRGVKDIGYPVFEYPANVAAALVVPFLEHLDGSHKVDIEHARQHLTTTASAISEALGYRASP